MTPTLFTDWLDGGARKPINTSAFLRNKRFVQMMDAPEPVAPPPAPRGDDWSRHVHPSDTRCASYEAHFLAETGRLQKKYQPDFTEVDKIRLGDHVSVDPDFSSIEKRVAAYVADTYEANIGGFTIDARPAMLRITRDPPPVARSADDIMDSYAAAFKRLWAEGVVNPPLVDPHTI